MLEMAAEDESLAAEIAAELDRLEATLADLELKALLNGPHDAAPRYCRSMPATAAPTPTIGPR